jgi:translocation protein SEC62
MLRHKFFHRARKIAVSENELKKKKKDKDPKEENDKDKESKEDTPENEENIKKEETVTAAETSQAEVEKGEEGKVDKRKKKQESEKKRRKIRLDMHLEQRFVDGPDAYVWIYEPTPYYNYVFGFLVVVAVIAICLFPLWPSSVRLVLVNH